MKFLKNTFWAKKLKSLLEKYKKAKEERDKCFPGKLHFVDLVNGRYISRKPIYDFITMCSENFKGKCLDFGCGSKQYEKLFKHTDEYIGIDVQDAKENGFNASDIVYYDGKIIPFNDNIFDCAISIEVFEHIFTDLESLKEINRVIKIGGFFLATVPMTFPLHLEPWDYHRYTEHGISNLVKEAGFEIVTIKPSTNFKNTIRRLKILEITDKYNRMNGIKKNIYYFAKNWTVFVNNLCFYFHKENTGNSKLTMNIMLLCRKR